MSDLAVRPDSIIQKLAAGNSNIADSTNNSFGAVLKDMVSEVNKTQIEADKAIAKVELDNSASIHEAVIALEKANISFRAMMQVRNKIVEAYQEIMRMQV